MTLRGNEECEAPQMMRALVLMLCDQVIRSLSVVCMVLQGSHVRMFDTPFNSEGRIIVSR